MAENTTIEWTNHTWSPIWTCTQISPACDNCYAKALAHRFGYGWNGHGQPRLFGDHHWNEPLRWNRVAAKVGTRPRVFPSMCDPFDKDWPAGLRVRFLRLISETPNLIWLLLTKRIGNVERLLREARDEVDFDTDRALWLWITEWYREGNPPENVWLGATVVNQAEADRDIPKLLQVPARVRFLSIEPMLGPIDLVTAGALFTETGNRDPLGRIINQAEAGAIYEDEPLLHWIICGGESGPGARPAHPDWFRSLRDQCAAAGLPFLFKQWGEWGPATDAAAVDRGEGYGGRLSETGRIVITPNTMQRHGKKAAGRHLDGVLHDEFPEISG